MTVQKILSSWLAVEPVPWEDESVLITPRGGEGDIVVLDDEDGVTVVSPSKKSKPVKVPKAADVPIAAASPAESIKMTLKGRTVVFCGMTKKEHDKEFEDGFETLLAPVVQDDQIVYWCLKADKVARLKELIGYYRERSQKLSQSDAVAYADDIAKSFVEPRDYLLEAHFLPKLVSLTKASLCPCLHFEIIRCLSNYFHYADLTYADVFLASEDRPLLDPPLAAIVESSIPEAIIEFLETGQEPLFLLPGKEVFVALLTLFKPLKAKLLQICTIEQLSEYLNEVDKDPRSPCPFALAPEIQTEFRAFLTLYIQHRFTPLLLDPPPAAIVESSIPEAIIEFLETGQEPLFLLPGKEVFVALLTLFKPLKAKLLQVCTVEVLSEYLNEVDKDPRSPCPFALAPEIQTEFRAFLTLYIQHRFTPLCTEEQPPSLIELQMHRLQQLKENAFSALEKVVHSANLNITFDRLNGEVRLEKNGISQDVSHPEPSGGDDVVDDGFVFTHHSGPGSPYS